MHVFTCNVVPIWFVIVQEIIHGSIFICIISLLGTSCSKMAMDKVLHDGDRPAIKPHLRILLLTTLSIFTLLSIVFIMLLNSGPFCFEKGFDTPTYQYLMVAVSILYGLPLDLSFLIFALRIIDLAKGTLYELPKCKAKLIYSMCILHFVLYFSNLLFGILVFFINNKSVLNIFIPVLRFYAPLGMLIWNIDFIYLLIVAIKQFQLCRQLFNNNNFAKQNDIVFGIMIKLTVCVIWSFISSIFAQIVLCISFFLSNSSRIKSYYVPIEIMIFNLDVLINMLCLSLQWTHFDYMYNNLCKICHNWMKKRCVWLKGDIYYIILKLKAKIRTHKI